tara:strand:+ start:4834 stop:5436 length:603 start_codon:yes stop_codon:yes gene_type:complete
MKSLSEIETTSKRASRAIGFSWGIAEEVAKGIRMLEFSGFPGIKSLNQYFKSKDKKVTKNLVSLNENNNLKFCPIILGVSFIDQIKTLETYKKITFKEIEHPLLFIPFLSRASEIIGKKILLRFDGKEFLLNFNMGIRSNFLEKKIPLIGKNAEVIFLENIDNFSDDEWENLYELSKDTFVEESDSLKKGAAGAGLTDND